MSETANKPKVDYSKIFDIYELNRKTREQKAESAKILNTNGKSILKKTAKKTRLGRI